VGAVGRLSPEKDFSTFLKIAAQVRQTMPEAHFVLVGEGPEYSNLLAESRDLSLNGGAILLGQRSDKINVYQSLDLLLLTSLREGLPNVVLEAMAMEVPVLATRVAGVGDLIVDQSNGFLFAPRDVSGMTLRTTALLADAQRRAAVARRARETVVSHFSFQDRVRRLEAVYREVMGRS
jgi:glycosyltransferase involved in cell wall biosynthesis